jgi:hypothetical protein
MGVGGGAIGNGKKMGRGEAVATGRAAPGARARSPAGGGRLPADPGGLQSWRGAYLLVHDGASHLADVRQAVVPGRVLQ